MPFPTLRHLHLTTILFSLLSLAGASAQTKSHTLIYAPGKSITLSLPANLDINIAARGLHRVRFLAQSPDGRIFATGMWNLADNTRGSVFILEGWNAKTHTFTHVVHYLDHLRNPNNLAFYTDPATRQSWLYLPLTDKLLRYKYSAGDNAPTSAPQILARFPDYGLNYKYGGWHLTRTVAFATLHGRTRLYLTAGSSCDYCREREVIRATLSVMDPDGSHWQILAHGLRNAVDLEYVPSLDGGALFATNMGDDHLGDKLPEDTFFELQTSDHNGTSADHVPTTTKIPNYGWPTCYFAHGKPVLDRTPLPEMPSPGDASTEAERPQNAGLASHSRPSNDSVYGAQPGMAQQGTLLTAHTSTTVPDPEAKLGKIPPALTSCNEVPAAYTTFAAHSSPLGLAWFGADNPSLHNTFLVALHGASHPHIGTGYRVVRFTPQDRTPQDFITGFLTTTPTTTPTTTTKNPPVVQGRPCGLLRLGPDTFLLTDDYLGLVYYIHPK
jgi:glucose/arabinose dehydrogenase